MTKSHRLLTASILSSFSLLGGMHVAFAGDADPINDLGNGAYWKNEEQGQGAYVQKTRAKEENPAAIVSKLVSQGGSIIQKDKRTITIESLDSDLKLFYGHDKDGTQKEHYTAGDTHIKVAAKGSKVTLYTDRTGIDTDNQEMVKKVLNSLATKLYYDAYKNNETNLTGKIGFAETLTAISKTYDLADLEFEKSDGKAKLKKDTITPLPKPTPKPTPSPNPTPTPNPAEEETPVIKSTKTAILSNLIVWNAQNNDLQKRLGELRLLDSESGAWGKYQGGSTSLDAKDSRNRQVTGEQKYHGVQIGYDRKLDDLTLGIAFGYMKNDDTYLTGTGKGKGTTISAALYASKVSKDGAYLDLIAKTGRVKSDYDVQTREYAQGVGDRIQGTYKGTGTLFSIEYGKRMEKNGNFYIEPSAEFTLSNIGDYDQTLTSEKQTKLSVHADAVTSFIGKVGISLWQKTDKLNAYGKLSLAHEFTGDIRANFTEENNTTRFTDVKMSDTWLDLEVGTSYKMSDDSYFYGTFSKNFGAKLDNKWRLDAGLRFAI